jgi:hypothetical protein
MKKGILIYAHNNRTVDYALMAVISAGLAKKQLQVPASLVTDKSTIDWMKESNIYNKATEIFEKIIEVDRPVTDNTRRLSDGLENTTVPFINSNRASAWELTPYDRTLLIDTDFLILSTRLGEYWDVDEDDVLIGDSINDVYSQQRLGYHDRYVSDTGIKLYWATTVMFTKNQQSKFFFELVNFVRENYKHYADLFRFDNRQYRNDISFSVAKHILQGFEQDSNQSLPPVLTALDKDVLYDVQNNQLKFLINSNLDNNFSAANFSGVDIHVMNKQSIVRNKDKLLGMI